MITKTLEYGKGYSGRLGNKCWLAAITGMSENYGLEREFLDPVKVEREHFNRPRTIIHFTFALDVGLYEYSECGERHFLVVWVNKLGEHKKFAPPEDRVRKMVDLMDAGMTADEARKATKAPKETTNGQTA